MEIRQCLALQNNSCSSSLTAPAICTPESNGIGVMQHGGSFAGMWRCSRNELCPKARCGNHWFVVVAQTLALASNYPLELIYINFYKQFGYDPAIEPP